MAGSLVMLPTGIRVAQRKGKKMQIGDDVGQNRQRHGDGDFALVGLWR